MSPHHQEPIKVINNKYTNYKITIYIKIFYKSLKYDLFLFHKFHPWVCMTEKRKDNNEIVGYKTVASVV